MKKFRLSAAVLALYAVVILAACSGTAASPAVSDSIRKSLDQAGLKDVSVSQDRDKGVVTLGGQVASETDKSQAEAIAKSLSGSQVVADQIAVIPVGAEKEAKAGAQLGQEKTSLQAATFATNSGKRLLASGDLDGAISQFRAAIHSVPTYAMAHYQLGVALAQKGQKDESGSEFQKASELDSRLLAPR